MRRIVLGGLLVLVGCGEVKDPGGVDAMVPNVDAAADIRLPVVTITDKPAAETELTATNFVFSADEPATFHCRLDAGTLLPCTSPQAFSALAIGAHTFEVQAQDPAGNIGTAMHAWTVVAPCTPSTIEAESITSHPNWVVATGSVLHNGMALQANANNVSFQVTFTGKGLTIFNEKGPSFGTVTVTVDTGTPVAVSVLDPSGFTFQNPTIVASGLPNVAHTATVACTQTNCQVDYFTANCQ